MATAETSEKKTRKRTKKPEYRVMMLSSFSADGVDAKAWEDIDCGPFDEARKAEQWLKANFDDGTRYRIVRVHRDVTAQKVVEEKVKLV